MDMAITLIPSLGSSGAFLPVSRSGIAAVLGQSAGIQIPPESAAGQLELHACLHGGPPGPSLERQGGHEHPPNLPGQMLSLTACSGSWVDC